jgi:hypothetical protein
MRLDALPAASRRTVTNSHRSINTLIPYATNTFIRPIPYGCRMTTDTRPFSTPILPDRSAALSALKGTKGTKALTLSSGPLDFCARVSLDDLERILCP